MIDQVYVMNLKIALKENRLLKKLRKWIDFAILHVLITSFTFLALFLIFYDFKAKLVFLKSGLKGSILILMINFMIRGLFGILPTQFFDYTWSFFGLFPQIMLCALAGFRQAPTYAALILGLLTNQTNAIAFSIVADEKSHIIKSDQKVLKDYFIGFDFLMLLNLLLFICSLGCANHLTQETLSDYQLKKSIWCLVISFFLSSCLLEFGMYMQVKKIIKKYHCRCKYAGLTMLLCCVKNAFTTLIPAFCLTLIPKKIKGVFLVSASYTGCLYFLKTIFTFSIAIFLIADNYHINSWPFSYKYAFHNCIQFFCSSMSTILTCTYLCKQDHDFYTSIVILMQGSYILGHISLVQETKLSESES